MFLETSRPSSGLAFRADLDRLICPTNLEPDPYYVQTVERLLERGQTRFEAALAARFRLVAPLCPIDHLLVEVVEVVEVVVEVVEVA